MSKNGWVVLRICYVRNKPNPDTTISSHLFSGNFFTKNLKKYLLFIEENSKSLNFCPKIFFPPFSLASIFFPIFEFYFENNFRPKKFWILAPKITTIVTLALCYDFWIFALKMYIFSRLLIGIYEGLMINISIENILWTLKRGWKSECEIFQCAANLPRKVAWKINLENCDRSNLSGDACVASQLFLRKFEYFTIIFQSNFAQDFWRHFLFRTIKSVKMFEINTNVSSEFSRRKR